MILKFYVNHQTLQLLSRDPVIADSSGYLQANFQFTDDWEGTDKTVQFKRTESKLITDGKPLFYDIDVDSDGNCTVPWEVLVGEGTFNVNVYGQKTGTDGTTVKTITVNSVDVPVGESGLTTGETPLVPTKSKYESMYEAIKKAQAAVASDKSAAATSEANASKSASNAKTSETAAKASQTAAKTSETNSVNSATASANSAKASATSAGNAAKSATASANSATASANSAKAASTSEANAKSSQTAAATSATNSANSATASASSATASANSAKAAKTSETNASSSASAASSSASAASTSANAAATSATNSANSSTLAKKWATYTDGMVDGSEYSAKHYAEVASTSATTATTKATEASTSASNASTSATNAKASETAAGKSATAAATSASAAKTSEQNAGTQANTAKAWATSTTSPDNAADTSSTTGKTQSAKSWAMYSKDRATASASSASAAAGSASAAKTSETHAASSKTAAATSATNAANSAKAAAESANQAAAGQINADWNETNADSKAYIKNKPDVLLKSGGTATGPIIAPSFQTGSAASNYFQCRKFRGDGNANAYYHAIDFGYGGHNQVDFYEYGGIWNFYKSTDDGKAGLVGSIQAGQGWNGLVKGQDITTYAKKSDLASSVSTKALTVTGETSVPTANEGNSSNAIASTEFVAKSLAKLVDSAPESLNTLNELAKALGNDPNFATTVLNKLAKKLDSIEAEDTYATKQDVAKALGDDPNFATTVLNELAKKQDKLTFDKTPTANSSNPVTSGGVKTYVDDTKNTLNTAISKKADSTDIVQADWNVTDTSSKAFIKNKPEVYPKATADAAGNNIQNTYATKTDVEKADIGYYIDTKYGLTNDNFTEKFSDFLAKAVENDKIALLTQTYTVNDAITIRADKVMLDSINGKLIGSGSIDFRAVKELYCRNIKYSITMKFNYRGDEEYKQKYRKIWIENCDAFGGSVQENFGLYISTPEPANGYLDRNQRDYTKYGIFLDNYSGYNALMIINKSIDDTGATIKGGIDNSALGITDRVTGVVSPAVLIDTTRNPFRVVSPDAPPNDAIHHVAFDMGKTGNISIGCSTLNADPSFSGSYNIKIFSDYPTIAMKNGNYNVKALMYVDKYLGFSLDGATVLKISSSHVTSIRNGNDIQLRLEGRNGNAVGLLVDDDGNLRISKYYTTSQDKDQPRLLYAGAVSSRPTLTHYAGDVGYMVFDTNLGKPIWWTGTNWVDATGTAV